MIVLKTTNGEQGKCNCLFGTGPAECIKSIPFTLIKKIKTNEHGKSQQPATQRKQNNVRVASKPYS